jgi:hypothetical protein
MKERMKLERESLKGKCNWSERLRKRENEIGRESERKRE